MNIFRQVKQHTTIQTIRVKNVGYVVNTRIKGIDEKKAWSQSRGKANMRTENQLYFGSHCKMKELMLPIYFKSSTMVRCLY